MLKSKNYLTIAAAERKESKEGNPYLEVRVAFNSKDKEGNAEPTFWVDGVAFGDTAEAILSHYENGEKSPYAFYGIYTDAYENKDGEKRSKPRITIITVDYSENAHMAKPAEQPAAKPAAKPQKRF